jgi:hypothetical protein
MLTNWLYWSVPAEKARHYIIVMTLMMVVLPYNWSCNSPTWDIL